MMDKREEGWDERESHRHPSREELIDWYNGPQGSPDGGSHTASAAPGEVLAITRHVEQCPTCRAELEEVRDFFKPASEGERQVLARRDRAGRFEALWRRVREEEAAPGDSPAVPKPFGPRPVRWRPSWPAVAAGLISFMLAGGWGWTWQRYRAHQAQWQAQEQGSRKQIGQLAAENQRLRTEQRQTQERLDQLSKRMQAPATSLLQAAVALVYSAGAMRRSGEGTPEPHRVSVPQGAPWVTLVLYRARKAEYSIYSAELKDASPV